VHIAIHAEERNVGVAEDDDLGGMLAKEVHGIHVQSELDQGKMQKQQIYPKIVTHFEMDGHGVRPSRTGGIHISANEYRLANRLQIVDQIETAYVSGVKNKRRAVLFKDGKEGGMGSSVRVGKDPDQAALGTG
jgi:hypothetical protein